MINNFDLMEFAAPKKFDKSKINLIINRMTGMAQKCILFPLHKYCVMIFIIWYWYYLGYLVKKL